jgi:hypothetical protein
LELVEVTRLATQGDTLRLRWCRSIPKVARESAIDVDHTPDPPSS